MGNIISGTKTISRLMPVNNEFEVTAANTHDSQVLLELIDETGKPV
jgi:hypothetical protein